MGDVPHIGTIHATVNRIWTIFDKSAKIDVQIISKTAVLFRIASPRTRERILKRKYWHIADIPLVVYEWNPEAAQAPPDLSAMPMWIDLRDVLGYLFSHKGLKLMSSTVGHFVKLHPTTERCLRLDVARILVEVNLQVDLTEKISFTNENGEEILVSVSYPWLPPKCKLCSSLGHKEKDCSKAEKVKILVKSPSKVPESKEGGNAASVQQLGGIVGVPLRLGKKEKEPAARSISPRGFRALEVVGEDEVQTLNSQSLVLQTNNDEEKEEGELVEKEDREKGVAESHEEVRPSFGCFVETRVQEAVSDSIISSILPGWSSLTNYDFHKLGRIWVCWNNDVSITPILKSAQHVSCFIMVINYGVRFLCSFVYASNFVVDRRALWADLCHLKTTVLQPHLPWIVLGDFNEILSMTDHSRAMDYTFNTTGMRDFQNTVSFCELGDLSSAGPNFTWINNQDSNPIGKKMDKALVTSDWLNCFSHSYASFEAGGISDHSRCMIHLSKTNSQHRKPFKFFNFLTTHDQFLPTVAQVWTTLPPLYHSRVALSLFHRKLKSLKSHLRLLNKSKFGDLPRKTLEAYGSYCAAQTTALSDPTISNLAALSETSETWQRLASLEEKFFHQKPRIQWMKCGDQNTSYFHRVAQTNASRNAVCSLTLESGAVLTDLNEIKAEAARHFREFLQAEVDDFEGVYQEYLSDLLTYRCSSTQCSKLVLPVSSEEVQKALFSLPSGKACGPDGYTKEFYVAAWSIIGNDFVVVVQSFFLFGQIPWSVAWIDVCRPKDEGGLGLRRLREVSRVYAYRLIWSLFTLSGSLWVAWTTDEVKPFICVEIGNGENTSFWFDSWLQHGRLIDVTGPTGPRLLGVPLAATVKDATGLGGWKLRRTRSAQLYPLVQSIRAFPLPQIDETRDHLFFACPYSFTVWSSLAGKLLRHHITPDWADTVTAIQGLSGDLLKDILIRLYFQVTVYTLWHERNTRIHNNGGISAALLIRNGEKLIRNRISSLDYSKKPHLRLLLQRWLMLRP
ncbi:unnamed protein product [Arabidopsis halleri]